MKKALTLAVVLMACGPAGPPGPEGPPGPPGACPLPTDPPPIHFSGTYGGTIHLTRTCSYEAAIDVDAPNQTVVLNQNPVGTFDIYIDGAQATSLWALMCTGPNATPRPYDMFLADILPDTCLVDHQGGPAIKDILTVLDSSGMRMSADESSFAFHVAAQTQSVNNWGATGTKEMCSITQSGTLTRVP